MTQIEVTYIMAEERKKGARIVAILPVPDKNKLLELPDSEQLMKEVKISPRELMVTEVDGYYVTYISKITADEEIKKVVAKIFDMAQITEAGAVFVC